MPPIPGLITTSLQIQEQLHEKMKTLRLAHRALLHEDIRLCRLYQQAVELYLNTRRQRELIAEYEAARGAGTSDPPEPLSQEALCADR